MLVCSPLERAGFVNGFSTRLGGVSPFPDGDLNLAGFKDDAAENIYENRRRFLLLFDGDFALASAWQVHGDTIKHVASLADTGDLDDHADALISELQGVLIGAKTADCVPVLIGDPVTHAFAAIHAGWRGTTRSIVNKTVEKLKSVYGCDAKDLVCAIGPAASGKNYEVGQDVINDFASKIRDSGRYFTPTRAGHWLVDLHAANRDMLTDAGVELSNIHIAPFCTMERPDLFFSYRLEKSLYGRTGRLMSVIGRNNAVN